MKAVIKGVVLSISAIFVAVLAATASYFITVNVLRKSSSYQERLKSVGSEVTQVSASAAISPRINGGESMDGRFKLYKVKLEDDMLNVYVNYEKHEELLYGEKVNLADLSEEDKKILTEGKTFEEMSAVTEFTENFTS